MIEHILQEVLALSQVVPLPVFTAIGSLVEELISPIPAQAIMLLGGSLAHAQYASLWLILFMAFTGSVGKLIGSVLYYVFADKVEDLIVPRYGKYLGITHEQLERVGARLGRGLRDDIALLLLRLIPVIPSGPVSVACGLFKINLQTFVVTALIGSFFRNIFYLLIGYYGWDAYRRFVRSLSEYKLLFLVAGTLVVLGGLIWGYRAWKRRRR